MNTMELESFVQKFNHVWKNGNDAHLNVHSLAGNAWVGISLNLGSFPGLSRDYYPNKKNVSPARSRRREKHAAARAETKTKSSIDDVQPGEGTKDVTACTEEDLASENSEKADANDAYTQISAGEACLVNEVDALFKVSSKDTETEIIDNDETSENSQLEYSAKVTLDQSDINQESDNDNSEVLLSETKGFMEVIENARELELEGPRLWKYMVPQPLKIHRLSVWLKKNSIP